MIIDRPSSKYESKQSKDEDFFDLIDVYAKI